MSHLNNTRKLHPGESLSQSMKRASKTYKKKRNQSGGFSWCDIPGSNLINKDCKIEMKYLNKALRF